MQTPQNSLPREGISYYDKPYKTFLPELIYVFGSNESGIHGKGAALEAFKRYGAVERQGRGHMLRCYAIPTKNKELRQRSVWEIEKDTRVFVEHTKTSGLDYYVTPVGTGLAGWNHLDIAPLFVGAQRCWMPKMWEPWLGTPTSDKIEGFFNDHRFLSNFWRCQIVFQGIQFQSVETAYQAVKSDQRDDWERMSKLSASEAKIAGKKLKLRDGWNDIKLIIMYDLLWQKFAAPHNQDLRAQLLSTGDLWLEEQNTWGDTYWGVCKGNGQNNLGKLLMQIRAQLNWNQHEKDL